MSVRVAIALWISLLAATGCRPPLARLTEQRAFDQALCAASERSRHPERDLRFVRDRIDLEARPRLHLHAIPSVELERTLGPAGSHLSDEVAVVRAVAAIDGVQVDDFQLRVVLVGPEGPVEAIPAHVERITEFTGETIPPTTLIEIADRRRLNRGRIAERPLLGIGAALLEASTFFIVPVTLATGHSEIQRGRTVVIEPTDAEVAASAPAAAMLADQAARHSQASYDQGQEVATVWLWPRPSGEDLRLVVEWSYTAHGCAGPRPVLARPDYTSAVVRHIVELPLPPGPTLEARLATIFGNDMRMLVR